MTDYNKVLRNNEKAVYDLRNLYDRHGYSRFKTGKFEDYELYADNKDFLGNDGILTFTGPNGRLMALKPDVTLSVAKDAEWQPGVVQKIYYDDEVYRMGSYSHEFKEIAQTGIECMGDIDKYDTGEVIMLAARSLDLISKDFVLDISHMGVINALIDMLGISDMEARTLLHCIREKNAHGADEIMDTLNIPAEKALLVGKLINTFGPIKDTLAKVEEMVSEMIYLASAGNEASESGNVPSENRGMNPSNEVGNERLNYAIRNAISDFHVLTDMLDVEGVLSHVNIDFSVVNEMGYYNGIMFTGFIKGITKPVIAGGRYDNLMKKMGNKCGAIGFSVSLDMLDTLDRGDVDEPDVDCLILHGEDTDVSKITEVVDRVTSEGKSVLVEKSVPKGLRYNDLIDLDKSH